MNRVTVAQVRKALAAGGTLPSGVRIAFGEPTPIQVPEPPKKSEAKKPAATKGGQ